MGDNGHHHLMSLKQHYMVIASLFALTIITVWVAKAFHFGAFNVAIALIIATTKALLVMTYFMHLKWDSKLNRVVFASSFFFLGLLALISFLDIYTRVNPRL